MVNVLKFLYFSVLKLLVIRAGICKIFVRIANREGSESTLFIQAFRADN